MRVSLLKNTIILLVFLFGFTNIVAQSNKTQNPPPETKQYQFIIGIWELEIQYKNRDGNWDKYEGIWENEWLVDGYLLHQAWSGPFIKGSEFKIFDTKINKWVGQYYYAGKQWVRTEGSLINNEIVTYKPNNNPKKPSINKETFFNISEKFFSSEK